MSLHVLILIQRFSYTERTQKEFSEAFVEFVKILRNQALIPEDIETMSTRK